MPDDTQEAQSDMVLLRMPRDDWSMIMDYIYGNLGWDSDSDEKSAMYAAMNRVREVIAEEV